MTCAISRFFHWLCELVTRRDCRERSAAVQRIIAQSRDAHAARLQSHRKLEHALRQFS